jgi:pimeloyl-ACP methyl ester carboxylesterase
MAAKPTLFLLPGIICDPWVWEPQAVAMAADFDVRRPSFFGFDSLSEMARSVLADAPPRFSVAGHSMGGRVALEMLDLAPDRIDRIALLDTAVHPMAPSEPATRMALVELARREGMDALVREWLPPMVHPDRLSDAAFMAPLQAMVRRATPEIYAAQVGAMLTRRDAAPLLDLIKVPCAIVVGRQDGWSPVAGHEAMAARVPGAALTIIEDCGHMSTVERPDGVIRALYALMRR